MNNLSKKLEWLNNKTEHNVAALFLQGSQNYDCDIYTDEYMSDIDVKAIIIPSFNDIITETKPFSYTYILEDDSHIDVKDIRLYIDLFKKQNTSYLEILFTEYKIVCNNEILKVLDMANEIQELNKELMYKAIKGMALEKYKALCHPYPNIKDEIEKYGYSRKQLHHMYRLLLLQRDIFGSDISFSNALSKSHTIKDKSNLMFYKTKFIDLDKVLVIADEIINEIKTLKPEHEKRMTKYNPVIGDKLKSTILSIIKNEVAKEFNKEEC